MSDKGRIEPRRLKGFRDYLPEVMAARYRLIDIIREEARLAGFQAIGTPALEYAATLVGQGGEETDKQVYRFQDHGQRDVALRFDLTVPFARFVAEHQGTLVFPFKKLQIGDVWRGENPQKGRYREFCQCDLDIIGVDGVAADVEILSVIRRILARAEVGPFTMAVGHRKVLSALIRRLLGVDAPEGETRALIAIDKLAKIGADKVGELLGALPGVRSDGIAKLLSVLTQRDARGGTDLAQVREALVGEEAALQELARLESVVALAGAGEEPGRLVADLSTARGLGYYTGIVFETTLDDLPGFGSISSGGRYNDLASRFTTRSLPGVGGSIGLDRLIAGLEELGRLKDDADQLIFVAVASFEAFAYGYDIARTLRRHGFAVDIGMTPKLAAQFKHADRLHCPYVITVGPSEQESGTYALKSMREGTETKDLPAGSVVAELQRRLGSSAG